MLSVYTGNPLILKIYSPEIVVIPASTYACRVRLNTQGKVLSDPEIVDKLNSFSDESV